MRKDAIFRPGFSALALVAAALVGTVLVRHGPDGRSVPTAVRHDADGITVPPPPLPEAFSVAHASLYELHGISVARGRRVALIARHGGFPQSYPEGAAIAPGLMLAQVGPGHVILDEQGARHRIDLPSRLGGSREIVAEQDRGLRPEPMPASGERSGADIARQVALTGGNAPVSPTPEEQDAARQGALPVAGR